MASATDLVIHKCAPALSTIDSETCSPTSIGASTEGFSANPVSSLQRSLLAARDIIVDVRANGPAATSDSRLGRLISQARELGSKTFWGNDVFADVSKRSGWRLNLLAQDSLLCGFIVYKADLERQVVEVEYLAVGSSLRGQGCGAKLIKWVQCYARDRLTRNQVNRVVCACVPESVGFYQRLGFKALKEVVAENEEERKVLIPGQIHMQWKVPPPKKK